MLKSQAQRLKPLSRRVDSLLAEEKGFSRKLILELVDLAPGLVSSEQFQEYTVRVRANRRKQREVNLLCYYQCVAMYQNKLRELLDRGIETLLLSCGQDTANFADRLAEQFHDQNFSEVFKSAVCAAKNRIRMLVQPTKELRDDELAEVLGSQLEYLRGSKAKILQMVNELGLSPQEQVFLPALCSAFVLDNLNYQHGVEEEDIVARTLEQQEATAQVRADLARETEQLMGALITQLQ